MLDQQAWLHDVRESAWGPLFSWAVAIAAAWVANLVARRVIVRGVRALVERTQVTWDDVFVEHRVFERLSHLAPAMVLYAAAPLLFDAPVYTALFQRFANVWMVLAGARAGSAFLDALVSLGSTWRSTRDKPIRSYAQVAKILLWLAVAIIVVATLMQKSPWALLTGLGALTALVLLVFKDSLLGLVASIHIAGNDLIRPGDWIEMPEYGADGDVIEIGLHTVKVRNWDKTITSIPTHAFLSDSFKNWRGMTESGGRRIKRSISLDMSSVRFLSPEDVERFREIRVLREYVDGKVAELEAWNREHGVDPSAPVNARRLTNLGTFRAYLEHYLRGLQDIRRDMTFLVRQLAPGPEGLPIEIYVFSGEQRWVQYEGLVSDVFDHVLAVVPHFDLRVFQRPSGPDVRALASQAHEG